MLTGGCGWYIYHCESSYPGLDERHYRPQGDAGDGGGGEDTASPLRPRRVGVHCAIVLLDGELGHVSHLEDDDKLKMKSLNEISNFC